MKSHRPFEAETAPLNITLVISSITGSSGRENTGITYVDLHAIGNAKTILFVRASTNDILNTGIGLMVLSDIYHLDASTVICKPNTVATNGCSLLNSSM